MPSRYYIICYNIYADKQKLIQTTLKTGKMIQRKGQVICCVRLVFYVRVLDVLSNTLLSLYFL